MRKVKTVMDVTHDLQNPCSPNYCGRDLLSPTVLKRSVHPAGSWSLLSKTKSFSAPFGCTLFHLEYKWYAYIPADQRPPALPGFRLVVSPTLVRRSSHPFGR
jgi:hypothetical protein